MQECEILLLDSQLLYTTTKFVKILFCGMSEIYAFPQIIICWVIQHLRLQVLLYLHIKNHMEPANKKPHGAILYKEKEFFNTKLAKARIKSDHCIGLIKGRSQYLKWIQIIISSQQDMVQVCQEVQRKVMLDGKKFQDTYQSFLDNKIKLKLNFSYNYIFICCHWHQFYHRHHCHLRLLLLLFIN